MAPLHPPHTRAAQPGAICLSKAVFKQVLKIYQSSQTMYACSNSKPQGLEEHFNHELQRRVVTGFQTRSGQTFFVHRRATEISCAHTLLHFAHILHTFCNNCNICCSHFPAKVHNAELRHFFGRFVCQKQSF